MGVSKLFVSSTESFTSSTENITWRIVYEWKNELLSTNVDFIDKNI